MANRQHRTFGSRRLSKQRSLAVHLDPPADTSRLPPIDRQDDGAEEDAARDWLVHLAAGRIAVR